jgi:hypothetical protein
LARGIIDSGQKPPFVKVLVSLSSLCPFGVRDESFIGWRDDIKVKLMSNNINIEENGDNGFNSNCVGFDYDG